MRKAILCGIAVAAFFAAGSALALQESAEDKYVACVIGKAAVLMHHGSDVTTAAAAAWDECASIEPPNLPSEEGEGISDFVYLTLEDIAD
jgi:hypothetical protein